VGASILSVIEEIPLMPDWFGRWGPVLRGLVAATAISLCALIAWVLVSWGWTGVVRSDERAFFARAEPPMWTGWALVWTAVAVAIPVVAIIVLALVMTSAGVVVAYSVIVALGLFAVLKLLPGRGRRLGDLAPAEVRQDKETSAASD